MGNGNSTTNIKESERGRGFIACVHIFYRTHSGHIIHGSILTGSEVDGG
jgi:hypothetical protein